jgi:hypothetical protein
MIACPGQSFRLENLVIFDRSQGQIKSNSDQNLSIAVGFSRNCFAQKLIGCCLKSIRSDYCSDYMQSGSENKTRRTDHIFQDLA